MEVESVHLRDLRRSKGFTQKDLAEKVGVSTSAVGNWEAGIRKPRYGTLRKLSDVLEVPIDDIKFPTKNDKVTNSRPQEAVKCQRSA